MTKRNLRVTALVCTLFFLASEAGAGPLFHATRKAAARRIAAKGFSPAKMNPKARFGKSGYLSNSASTAKLEAKGADTVLRIKPGRGFERRVVDLRNPTPAKLRTMAPRAELRGTVKNGVIGPKLGRQVGRTASRNDQIIKYRSVKNPARSNFAIPRKVYESHPRLVKVMPP